MMLKIKSVQTIVAGLTFLLALLTKLLLKLQGQQNRKAHHPSQKLQMMMIRSEVDSSSSSEVDDERYGLSWRLAVETNNNVRPWKTVPARCYKHVENYILDGQYELDMNMIVDEIIFYAKSQIPVPSNKDAWILDVDDTCISNIPYYKNKRFGYVYFIICSTLLGLHVILKYEFVVYKYLQMRAV